MEGKMESKHMGETLDESNIKASLEKKIDPVPPQQNLKPNKKTPLELFHTRAKTTSLVMLAISFLMLILTTASTISRVSEFTDYSIKYPSLAKTTTITSFSPIPEIAMSLSLICAGVFGIALIFWIASNLLIAYKRS